MPSFGLYEHFEDLRQFYWNFLIEVIDYLSFLIYSQSLSIFFEPDNNIKKMIFMHFSNLNKRKGIRFESTVRKMFMEIGCELSKIMFSGYIHFAEEEVVFDFGGLQIAIDEFDSVPSDYRGTMRE